MKGKYIVGISIIVVFLIFAGLNFRQSITPYVSVSVAKSKGTLVQIKGKRVDGSAHFDMNSKTFNFEILDEDGQALPVIYHGVKPSNFDEASHIVAKGRYSNGVFEANELLVKCPSKYEAETFEGAKS